MVMVRPMAITTNSIWGEGEVGGGGGGGREGERETGREGGMGNREGVGNGKQEEERG